ncbi:tetratricopeptide repeat protein [Jannaschia seohaensis]|uniref:Uncharacterized protein n=1 Tax=Jannaschia seohaensis TaxID=475081 RepID=A0A2Y9C0Q1_9RHOB|nr:hypothetical protein [Jannaschia seohaensis]PWJ18117.1 hypothetical protein BCF38_105104 [Jannaschia seohaensis]SSA46642.1 hypothetical protein SAMN05421539_105104 [Jannaschia seohaensis]
MLRPILAALFAASPVLAECPPAPDISAEMDALIAQIGEVENEMAARPLSNAMWEQWLRAPDRRAQELLDEGMSRRSSYDFLGAIAAFDALIEYCPNYAEGYNQRAFANFLRSDFAAALPDLDRAIALRPRHVAAIAGKGLTLISMGRVAEGQDAIREAVALNPWLSERRLLDMPAEPLRDGIDL